MAREDISPSSFIWERVAALRGLDVLGLEGVTEWAFVIVTQRAPSSSETQLALRFLPLHSAFLYSEYIFLKYFISYNVTMRRRKLFHTMLRKRFRRNVCFFAKKRSDIADELHHTVVRRSNTKKAQSY